jgi:hypothetical protein
LVLSALGAGGLATLFVPPYREMARMPDSQPAVSTPATPGGTSHGMTGINNAKFDRDGFIRTSG